MRTPEFGFSISPGDVSGVAAESRGAERLGYDRIGIWDSPTLFREPWIVLAAMARDTSSIAIGTWVTNPLSRHPVVTVSALASLDDLAPGRVYLGIGSGGTGVLHLGLEAGSLAQLKEYVLAVRQLGASMQAGATRFDGAIDAPLPEHQVRITALAKLVLPQFRPLDAESRASEESSGDA